MTSLRVEEKFTASSRVTLAVVAKGSETAASESSEVDLKGGEATCSGAGLRKGNFLGFLRGSLSSLMIPPRGFPLSADSEVSRFEVL